MGYTTRQKIEKIAKDVALVQKEARVIITIKGNEVSVFWNEYFRLNVIAIVGEGSVDGVACDEMVLCEVGISRVRPYQLAQLPKGKGRPEEPNSLHSRHVYGEMTRRQYELIAPVLFYAIQELADRAIAGRCVNPDNPFMKDAMCKWIMRGSQKISAVERNCVVESGMRFAVHCRERFLANDIQAAELFHNVEVRSQIKRAARFASLYVHKIKRSKAGLSKKDRDHFVAEVIDRAVTPVHFWIEAILYLQTTKKIKGAPELAEMLAWDGKMSKEREGALAALPGVKERLQGMRLRLTRKHANPSIIMFEVFASPQWKQYQKMVECDESDNGDSESYANGSECYDDEVPF